MSENPTNDAAETADDVEGDSLDVAEPEHDTVKKSEDGDGAEEAVLPVAQPEHDSAEFSQPHESGTSFNVLEPDED